MEFIETKSTEALLKLQAIIKAELTRRDFEELVRKQTARSTIIDFPIWPQPVR